ncbi:MAG: hypothetical protein J6A21_08140, partial [Lentisphaeria bacterium]|nr:hypothetical protein [Lentisphaeria bacterium]
AAPQTPAVPPTPAPQSQTPPQEAPKPAAPEGLTLRKEEKKKKEAPPADGEKKDDGKEGEKKKGKTDLANPLMKARQEEQKKKKKKKQLVTLCVLGGILLVLAASVLVIGPAKVGNSITGIYNKLAKKANIAPLKEKEGKSPLVTEMEKLVSEFEKGGLSQSAVWNKCEEFMATKPDPVTDEEVLLYRKLRTFFVPADEEKCEKSRNEENFHEKYLAAEEEKNRQEAEEKARARQRAWEEAKKQEAERKAAEIRKLNEGREAKAKAVERRIQGKRHQEMVKVRRAFYDIFYDFTTTIPEKQAAVRKLFTDAGKLRRFPTAEEEPDFEEARRVLGGKISVLRQDSAQILADLNKLFNSHGLLFRLDSILRKGDKRLVGVSVVIKNRSCKVEKLENFTIYGKIPGLDTLYVISLEEMRNTNPRQLRKFIHDAFGPYNGMNREMYLPACYALNGDIKMASFLGEAPAALPAAKRYLANFYKPYFDYVLKQNKNDAELRKKLEKALGETQSLRDYIDPPKPAPKAPPKAAPKPAPKKPAPKKPAAPPKKK